MNTPVYRKWYGHLTIAFSQVLMPPSCRIQIELAIHEYNVSQLPSPCVIRVDRSVRFYVRYAEGTYVWWYRPMCFGMLGSRVVCIGMFV